MTYYTCKQTNTISKNSTRTQQLENQPVIHNSGGNTTVCHWISQLSHMWSCLLAIRQTADYGRYGARVQHCCLGIQIVTHKPDRGEALTAASDTHTCADGKLRRTWWCHWGTTEHRQQQLLHTRTCMSSINIGWCRQFTLYIVIHCIRYLRFIFAKLCTDVLYSFNHRVYSNH